MPTPDGKQLNSYTSKSGVILFRLFFKWSFVFTVREFSFRLSTQNIVSPASLFYAQKLWETISDCDGLIIFCSSISSISTERFCMVYFCVLLNFMKTETAVFVTTSPTLNFVFSIVLEVSAKKLMKSKFLYL